MAFKDFGKHNLYAQPLAIVQSDED